MEIYSYKKGTYLDEMRVLEEKIHKTKIFLENCYIDEKLSFNNKLKMSNYMDKLINKYYRLKKVSKNIIN